MSSNKQFPKVSSDEELEKFVDEADLSEYDFSGFKPMNFEYAPKDASVTLRMPSALLSATKALAKQQGISRPFNTLSL
jgi:predicted DNA binding CopG/RHH family protein